MKAISVSFLRCKIIDCRISSIDERINRLQELNLFFQRRFDTTKSDKIKNRIDYLSKKKEELMAAFQYGS